MKKPVPNVFSSVALGEKLFSASLYFNENHSQLKDTLKKPDRRQGQ
jgi:hypothetical protein